MQEGIKISASHQPAVPVQVRSRLWCAYDASKKVILQDCAPNQTSLCFPVKARLVKGAPSHLPSLTTHKTSHPQVSPGQANTRRPRLLGRYPATGVERKVSLLGTKNAPDAALTLPTPLHLPLKGRLHSHQPLPLIGAILFPFPHLIPVRRPSCGTILSLPPMHGMIGTRQTLSLPG